MMGLEGISVIDWSSNFSADWVDLVDKNSLIEDNCSTWKQEDETQMQVPPTEAAVTVDEKLDVKTALRRALKSAIVMDGVAKGLHEAAKALDKRQAYFCVLAENCDEPMYTKLVEALCNEHQIPLIKIKDKKQLGEWIGLCKYDKEGKARKIVGCSCVVVRDYGQDDAARAFLQDYFDSQKKG
uniref:40S ribosomal protein S12 n=2 Tax=Onchocerca TaxID=6281 RepID=A0A8R1XTB6_ONCVO